MKVFLTSTPDSLAPHRAAAERVVRELGWEPTGRDEAAPAPARIEDALSRIDRADLVLSIVGWGRGPVPPCELGGDGARPWAQWEVGRALGHGRPVVVLMSSEPIAGREESAEARAVVSDFRAELSPLAVPFDAGGGVARFEAVLRSVLGERSRSAAWDVSAPFSPRSVPSGSKASSRSLPPAGLTLRTWPAPPLPEQPWPVLLPYTHPDLLGGRDRELAELRERLERPLPILALHAPSGSGKSSLLLGGLVPTLRATGRAVAIDRHPAEPGLASRLTGDLLQGPADALDVADDDHETFVDRLATARRRAGGRPPVLVLDQLEDVLRGDRRARATLGTLLAATVRRQPGLDGPLCRWLLAHRREHHGPLVHWLADPLREARALGLAVDDLPHDLTSLDRFHAWALPPLGSASAGASDPAGAAAEAFHAALTAPLALVDAAGRPRYRIRFEGDGGARLARAFGEARVRQRTAPLAPELQVVLAHLVSNTGEPAAADAETVLVVPDDPGRLLDDALEEHLGRALATFRASDRVGRTRALLALRELADAEGRRAAGRSGGALAQAIGRDGREALERMQAPFCRLVVAERRGDGVTYALAHDRLAEVIVRAVDGAAARGRLAVDPDLLALRRFVVLQSELYESGERDQATKVSPRNAALIETNAETFLIDAERVEWWQACRARRRADKRRRVVIGTIVGAVVLLASLVTWSITAKRAAREALLGQVANGKPREAFVSLVEGLEDPAIPAAALREALRRRKAPLDVLELGSGSVPGDLRAKAVLDVAELAQPLLAEAPGDDVRLATFLWALDEGPSRVPALAARARKVRDRALAPLLRRVPPPAVDDGWVSVPSGSFRMGRSVEEKDSHEDQRPVHEVAITGFRMLAHEVTNAEYRRLHPEATGEDELPAAGFSWYSAYVYSAWLGGRLPTEAEWEYAARAGCRFARCRRDGTEARVDEVAWTMETSAARAGDLRTRPVKRLEPNPWGLHDMLGNVWEWTTDWFRPYRPGHQLDPWGPPQPYMQGGRVYRGGAFGVAAVYAHPAYRGGAPPGGGDNTAGFRPVIPASR